MTKAAKATFIICAVCFILAIEVRSLPIDTIEYGEADESAFNYVSNAVREMIERARGNPKSEAALRKILANELTKAEIDKLFNGSNGKQGSKVSGGAQELDADIARYCCPIGYNTQL